MVLTFLVSVGIPVISIAALIFLITRPVAITANVLLITLGVLVFLALVEKGAELKEDFQDNRQENIIKKRQVEEEYEKDENYDDDNIYVKLGNKVHCIRESRLS